MNELPHTVVGAAIALKISNPALAIALALTSHFVLDLIPHWNPHLYTEIKENGKISFQSKKLVIFDTAGSIVAGILIASFALPNFDRFLTVIIACLAAVLPDLVEAPYFFLGVKNKLLQKWIVFQRSIQFNIDLPLGALTQILVLLTAFWWISK